MRNRPCDSHFQCDGILQQLHIPYMGGKRWRERRVLERAYQLPVPNHITGGHALYGSNIGKQIYP